MYELVVRNDYSVDSLSIQYDPIIVDGELIDNLTSEIENNELNVFDIEFVKTVKKADKFDYLFAVFSGVVSFGVNKLITKNNKHNQEETEKNQLSKEDLKALINTLLKSYDYSNENLKKAEEQISDFLLDGANKVRNAHKYKQLAVDFAHGLNYKALAFSILENIFGVKIGRDDNGNLAIERINNKELIGSTLSKKVYLGIINWIIHESIVYDNKTEYKKEINDLLKINGGIKKIKPIIKEIHDTNFYKDKEFDETKLYAWFAKEVNNAKEDDEFYDIEIRLNKETLPLFINKLLTRSYILIRAFINEIKEHDIRTIKGLQVIDLSNVFEESKRLVTRIDTVSVGVFEVCDIALATALTAKECATNFATDLVSKDYLKIITRDLPNAAKVFVTNINIAGVFEFVTLIKADKDYIIEDIKSIIEKPKEIKYKKQENISVSSESISKIIGLNKPETKILYSLELQIIKNDIKRTKDNKKQILKDEWRKEWMSKSQEALGLNKLYEEDEEKIYKAFLTRASLNDDSWMYKIILELLTFKPYCQLNEDKNKYKSLKLVDNNYLKDTFCQKQPYVSYNEIQDIKKTFKKYQTIIGTDSKKNAILIATTLVVTIASAGAAFAFAPAIAVALVGGTYTSLSGAALTSASLALVGGGSLAAGGLGMAGGALIIAGGGALAGLGASGLTSTAFILASSPSFVLNDFAKLLTKCDYILLKKYNMRNEVSYIQKNTEEGLKELNIKISAMKSLINKNEDKYKANLELIKEYEKSVMIINNANKELLKLLNKKLS